VTINRLRRAAIALAVAAVLAAGCEGGPNLAPVEGTVFLDGSPVQAGETVTGYVVLHADPARGNTSMEDAKATIGPDGKFAIYTRDKPGAGPGWYFVTVELARTNPNNPYDFKTLIDEKYLDKAKSGLAFEVVPKPEPGRYDIRLDGLSAAKRKGK
jgi:hypothetical protein